MVEIFNEIKRDLDSGEECVECNMLGSVLEFKDAGGCVYPYISDALREMTQEYGFTIVDYSVLRQSWYFSVKRIGFRGYEEIKQGMRRKSEVMNE
jgi:hypothetical protein